MRISKTGGTSGVGVGSQLSTMMIKKKFATMMGTIIILSVIGLYTTGGGMTSTLSSSSSSSSSLTLSSNPSSTTRTRTTFTTINDNKQQEEKKSLFRGNQYWKHGVTLGFETIYETTFARFQIHKVLLEDGKTIIHDWLWLDESDVINVLVENEYGQFVVLYQSKYGILTPTYAIVGGLMEVEEVGNPLLTAQREIREELGMESNHWTSLGGYRTAANRGAGTTYLFLARHARNIVTEEKPTTTTTTGRGGDSDGPVEGELERQDVVLLTRHELLEKLLAGAFQEIKWTSTIALSLLKIMQEEKGKEKGNE